MTQGEKSYSLYGIANPLKENPAFTIPLFIKRGSNDIYRQVINGEKRIGSFHVANDLLSLLEPLTLTDDVSVTIGDEAFYCVNFRDGDDLVGPYRTVAIELAKWVEKNTNFPFFRVSVLKFLEIDPIHYNGYLLVYQHLEKIADKNASEFWRDFDIFNQRFLYQLNSSIKLADDNHQNRIFGRAYLITSAENILKTEIFESDDGSQPKYVTSASKGKTQYSLILEIISDLNIKQERESNEGRFYQLRSRFEEMIPEFRRYYKSLNLGLDNIVVQISQRDRLLSFSNLDVETDSKPEIPNKSTTIFAAQEVDACWYHIRKIAISRISSKGITGTRFHEKLLTIDNLVHLLVSKIKLEDYDQITEILDELLALVSDQIFDFDYSVRITHAIETVRNEIAEN